jgi:hypothetical protein
MDVRKLLLIAGAGMVALAGAAACGGGDDGDGDATATTTRPAASATARGTSTAAETPAAGETQTGGQATQPAGSGSPVATQPAGGGGVTLTAAEAPAFLDAVVLKPADLDGNFNAQSDTTADNAAAAAADPEGAASNERCGRLLGRTVTYIAEDNVERYISGETVSFFSQVTAYASAQGAADCAAEAAVRLAEPGALARAFGSVFIDPGAVEVTQVQYPQVADGSFAATLRGQINAGGTIVDLTILIVAFRAGNATAVVGSAAASAPSTTELTPLVNLVLDRIRSQQ